MLSLRYFWQSEMKYLAGVFQNGSNAATIKVYNFFSWYFCTSQLNYETDSLVGFLNYIEDMRGPSQIITNRNAEDLGLAN